jgi:hypothetical protein
MRRRYYLTLVAAFGCVGGIASAAQQASDSGANYVSTTWNATTEPNLGSGFGPWESFATNNNSPPYAGTYLDLPSYNNSANIEAVGADWGTYANSGPPAPAMDLVRPFVPAAGGYSDPSSLGTLYNQTFSMAMASNGIGGSAAIGFSLDVGQGGSGSTAISSPALTLEYVGGGADALTLIDNNGTDNTAVPISYINLNAGISVSVAVGTNPDGLNPYTLTISPLPGNSTFTTPVVLTGSENGPLQQVDMFTDATSGDGFFNSLSISPEAAVPEPASITVLGGVTLMTLRRRRSQR